VNTDTASCNTNTRGRLDALKLKGSNVRSPDIYIPPLSGKPEQQRFTIQSDVLTSISSKQWSLPKRRDFGSAVFS